ncbi:MAG: hypothetical protein JO362_16260 [Streptomycetaceae bacterium]|nr:hypothetical protein [Streptomycetaceae bacterium]
MSPFTKYVIAVTIVGVLFVLSTISFIAEWHSSSDQYTKIFGSVGCAAGLAFHMLGWTKPKKPKKPKKK